MSFIIDKVKELTMSYLLSEKELVDIPCILEELNIATGISFEDACVQHPLGYISVQESLGTINEKEYIRKKKGVYYTPSDVVAFIISNAIKLSKENCKDDEGFDNALLKKKVFDPTCGAGEFLLAFLETKLKVLQCPSKALIKSAVTSIYGNDINTESTLISKVRLLLCVYQKYGDKYIKGLGNILKQNFTNIDFVSPVNKGDFARFDFVVGNPPYVEDSKCDTLEFVKFGNIYCNVIANSIELLKPEGSLGFVIPLSYISTPRMEKIRSLTIRSLREQIILSFADRPDCLFTSVHQKLCVLIGNKGKGGKIITSGYQYWYKSERANLFDEIPLIRNSFLTKDFIPKIGLPIEESIYKKIGQQPIPIIDCMHGSGNNIHLNMRACFWIKAFSKQHIGSEYKEFCCENEQVQQYLLGIFNSTLFWWYWVCVSDCWHITKKELNGFRVPMLPHDNKIANLAQKLESKLELTKKYVGTKQTDYEYKHKSCLNEIEQLDREINAYFGLTPEESNYIISFAKKYRSGGGME